MDPGGIILSAVKVLPHRGLGRWAAIVGKSSVHEFHQIMLDDLPHLLFTQVGPFFANRPGLKCRNVLMIQFEMHSHEPGPTSGVANRLSDFIIHDSNFSLQLVGQTPKVVHKGEAHKPHGRVVDLPAHGVVELVHRKTETFGIVVGIPHRCTGYPHEKRHQQGTREPQSVF